MRRLKDLNHLVNLAQVVWRGREGKIGDGYRLIRRGDCRHFDLDRDLDLFCDNAGHLDRNLDLFCDNAGHLDRNLNLFLDYLSHFYFLGRASRQD